MKNFYYNLNIPNLRKDLRSSVIQYQNLKTISRSLKDSDEEVNLDIGDIGLIVTGIIIFSTAPVTIKIDSYELSIKDFMMMSFDNESISQLSIQTISTEEITVEITLLGKGE